MKLMKLILMALAVSALIAVYWGQNSYGGEKLLGEYCQLLALDVVLLSFMNGYPNLELNFGGACSEKSESGLLHCPQIAKDIKLCQALGKKILLSLGGAIGNYGFSDDSEAEQFAQTLWDKFGGGSDHDRPFDDAIIDGFDFDVENKNQVGYVALGKKLRQLFGQGSKKFYLSAAPQCVYPDESVGELMLQVPIDYAFVQFYNNPCAVEKQFNWDTWQSWASSSPNPNVKLYLGLPGAPLSAGSGYIDSKTIGQTIKKIQGSGNFGGVMFWDASSSFGNGNMIDDVANALGGSSPAPPTTTNGSPSPSPSPSSYLATTLSKVYGTPSSSTAVASQTGNTDEDNFQGVQKAIGLQDSLAPAPTATPAAATTQDPSQSYDSTLTLVVTQTVLDVVPLGYDNSGVAPALEASATTGGDGQPIVTVTGSVAPTTMTTHIVGHVHKKTAFATVTQYTTIYV